MSHEKRGVGLWNWDGANHALETLGATHGSWFYTWKPHADGVTPPRGVEFVPMIWGRQNLNESDLEHARRSPSRFLLTFNEPNIVSQANMTVQEALDAWPSLQRLGKQLGSPAIQSGVHPTHPRSWLARFMKGAKERGFRVDFVCVHHYIADWKHADQAVEELRTFLVEVYQRYQKPIWLTEFGMIRWLSHRMGEYPSTKRQAEFAHKVQPMLRSLGFVHRYAWFSASRYGAGRGENTHLFRADGTPTPVGTAYFHSSLH